MKNSVKVAAALDQAVAVTWDTCHKIYVIKDNASLSRMLEAGYGKEEGSIAYAAEDNDLFDVVYDWYEESCELRMIDAVSVVDGQDVHETLVEQFEDEEDEDEE